MKPTTIPVICSMTLAAVIAAGSSHWWSVHQFSAMVQQGLPVLPPPAPAPLTVTPTPLIAGNIPIQQPAPQNLAPSFTTFNQADSDSQKAFYEALIEKMTRMEHQNRDLLDQLAETNRDIMKLEFRVDTHSESFRPLPVVEEKPFTSLNPSDAGVLPPRATPADLPSYE